MPMLTYYYSSDCCCLSPPQTRRWAGFSAPASMECLPVAGARGAMMKRMLRNTLDPSQALLRRRGKVEGGVLRNGLSL